MSDTMLLGVLRMPFELAMSTLTARIQYHQRGVQAADEIEELLVEVLRLTRQRDEARAALQPFAAEAQRYDPDDGDDSHPAWDSIFSIKHFRAARKALEAKP